MKTIVLIQARMGSTRLPEKVMRPINGRPMIELLLNRISNSKLVDEIIVATSINVENDILVNCVNKLGFKTYRGSENDVLDRFYEAAKFYKADVIVRITADCPLVDPEIIDSQILEFIRAKDLDYLANALPPTYPDGLDVEVFKFEALERAALNATSTSEREHVTGYIVNSGKFKVGNFPNEENYSNERWTVDQIEDFIVIENIYNHFYPKINFGWKQVLKLKKNKPQLFISNQNIMRNEGFMLGKFKEINLREIKNFKNSDNYRKEIHDLIPGGAHTYSKGDDQFPLLSPAAISHGKGSNIWDIDGNQYLDCTMGLSSISLGHAYEPVVNAIKYELDRGVNFQRPSKLEKEIAENFLELLPQHDMIKFAKNGSTVTTAAVKLARAKTGRKLVAFPSDHPFYSYDDWFIGTTQCNKGVPDDFSNLSVTFKSCDINSLKQLFIDYPNQIACVITEPEKNLCGNGCNCKYTPKEFLTQAIDITHENGALFILDEMITGFKTDFPGSITKYSLNPDMATWGKGIANGFSFCALTGKKEVMGLGGIVAKGEEKVFLISSTHGGETTALAAAISTIEEFKKHKVVDYINAFGERLIEISKNLIHKNELDLNIQVVPSKWMPVFIFKNNQGEICSGFRTLVMQEMIKRGVLFQGAFVISYSHTEDDLYYFSKAFNEVLKIYKETLNDGFEKVLIGDKAEAVFRKIL